MRWSIPDVVRGRSRKLLAAAGMLLLWAVVISEWSAAGGLPRGTPAPPLAVSPSDGPPVSVTSAGPGEVLVLSFWASWCPSCRREIPALNEVHQNLSADGRGRVVGINVEDVSREAARRLADRLELDVPVATATTSILDAWQVERLPTTYVVTPGGRVTATFVGSAAASALTAAVDRASRARRAANP